MSEQSERRRHERIPVNLAATVKRVEERVIEELTSTVRDISSGGLFLESEQLYEPGSALEVNLRYFDDDEEEFFLLNIIGVVRWQRESSPKGMGIEVMRASSSSKAQLDRLIQRQGQKLSKLASKAAKPEEIQPFLLCRPQGDECALWTLPDGQRCLALFLSGDSAASFRDLVGSGSEWHITRPTGERLLDSFQKCVDQGIRHAVLDPDEAGYKQLFDLEKVLRTGGR